LGTRCSEYLDIKRRRIGRLEKIDGELHNKIVTMNHNFNIIVDDKKY
jgi:hypothetical protein